MKVSLRDNDSNIADESLDLKVFYPQISQIKNDKEELLNFSEQAQTIQRKIDALLKEIEESNGQVGFAFSELIDVTKVKKGK